MNQATVFKIFHILEDEIKSLAIITRGVHTDIDTRQYAKAELAGIQFSLDVIREQLRKQ